MMLLAIVCAVLVTALCVLAIRAKVFRDNWLQHAGMFVLVFGAGSVAWHGISHQHANVRETTVMLGLALYGLGTALKTWWLNRKPPGQTGGPKRKHSFPFP